MGMVPPSVPRPIHSKAPAAPSPWTEVISWRQSGNDALVISSMAAMSAVGALTGSLKSAPGAKKEGKSPSGPSAASSLCAHEFQSMNISVSVGARVRCQRLAILAFPSRLASALLGGRRRPPPWEPSGESYLVFPGPGSGLPSKKWGDSVSDDPVVEVDEGLLPFPLEL